MKNFLFLVLLFIGWSGSSQVNGLRLENITYPFPVSEITIDSQGQKFQMAYMDVAAKKPNGKTIILLHGKNFAGYYWEQTAKDLNKAGYRIIIPDQIGFGKSSKPTDIQYSFQWLAQNTKAILDNLRIDKAIILGHSMGGMLATRFALMYPEITEKLILENPIGLEDWKTVMPNPSIDDWYKSELKQTAESIKEYQLKFYFDNKWKPEYDKGVEMLAGWTRNKEYPTIAKNSALTYDMIFTQPVVYEFQNLNVPTLLIIGQRDRTALGKSGASKEVQAKLGNYPKLGKETQAKIKGSKLVEIDNVGHMPHIESYEKFLTPLLDFLKG